MQSGLNDSRGIPLLDVSTGIELIEGDSPVTTSVSIL